jgi:hypothetical protein
MADELETPDTNATPQAEPAAQPAAGATTLTLEQVQTMIAEATQKAHDSAYAKARRDYEGKQPKPPKTETKNETKPTEADPLAILALRDSFDEAIDGLTINAAQKKFLRDRVLKERPDDVKDFIANAVEVMGLKQPQNTNPAASAKESTLQKPVIPATPAPGAVPDREGEPAFRALTEEAARDMWQAYVRRKGANPGNPYDPKNRGVWRELRRRFEAEASISSIRLGARRG